MNLTPDDIESIAELTAKKLIDEKRAKWVDPDTHDNHHEWVRKKMQDENDRRAMRRRVIESALIWALPIFLTFFAGSIFHSIKAWILKP